MNELSKRQVKAAQLEATGMLAKGIAKECKVSPQTISAYRKLDEYQVLVSKCAKTAFRAAQLQLIGGASKAVSTILEVMDSDNAIARLRAAECVLERLGMVAVEDEIGPTSVAEKKAGELYQKPDMCYFKDMFEEVDDVINKLRL